MDSSLSELKIGEFLVEELSGIPTSELLIVDFSWHFFGKKRPKIMSFMVNQVLTFGLSLIISLPLALTIVANTNYSPDDPELILMFFQITVGFSLIITLGWNIYIWFKTKPLVTLASLVDEIKKYNEAIRAVEIIERLTAAGNLQVNLTNRQDTVEALTVTRESLICALKTERIFRENQDFIDRRYELFANIENNLTALMAFDIGNQASEYGQLLNEALKIGTSVQKEVRKLQNKEW
ncbi:MAG: hypothetical protein F6K35_49790 [Okeania sp. SIO2H7]|nr:hypothetical protein [Okeania sp. SIO2H7]